MNAITEIVYASTCLLYNMSKFQFQHYYYFSFYLSVSIILLPSVHGNIFQIQITDKNGQKDTLILKH